MKLWAQTDIDKCPCQGEGWVQVDIENWHQCSFHYHGQLHPEAKQLLLDEPARLLEEERKALLNYKILEKKVVISNLQYSLKLEQEMLLKLELELINKTATVKAMPAVKV